ncbi:hydroxysteroid 11-beta-dehydrogenase 1-like protein isoform X6 [Camelus dromedarius]|uniref:Hydroxysteroid 11-beta-dehydrogenase 1-like protein isoform X4 n=1 Tax=Camelus bactrianus TaxID=9837 RepID=A0AC58PAQ4_CAMBA
MITWSQWWPWRWARGGRAKAGGITACSSNKDTVGEMGMTVGQACAGHLSPAADPGRAMKMLLLTGLGALFFAYYWDDNFNPGELPELRATNFVGAAQSDRQQGLPGGGVLVARPRAHLLLQPLLGGQVRSGQLLWLSPAGAGRAGRECGYHHVRPGPPGSRLSRGGCQGRHEGQGGSRAQGSSGCDPRRRHTCLWRLLPMALPPALPASRLAALPEGLVHPPGSQHHGPRCCLSSEDFPANYPGARTHTKTPLREWRRSRRKSSRQKSKTETNYQHLKTIRTPCATVDSLPGILPGTWKTTPQPSQLSLKI